MYVVVTLTMFAGCQEARQKTDYTSSRTMSKNIAKDTIQGIFIGNPFDLQGIGVRHYGEAGNEFVQMMSEVEDVFSIQIEQKILVSEHSSFDRSKYGKFMRDPDPGSWMSKKMISTHPIYINADLRSRTLMRDYDALLKALGEMIKRDLLKLELVEDYPLPVYKATGDHRVLTGLSQRQRQFMADEYKFNSDIKKLAGSYEDALDMRYMAYAGASHVYRAWKSGDMQNVYFALTPDQIDTVARSVAEVEWLERNLHLIK